MDEHPPTNAKVFRYKLDFYYQQSLFYLVTLVLYTGIRGSFTFDRLPDLTADPILYIIITFVVISFIVLLLNKSRDRKLMIEPAAIVFTNKYYRRDVPVADIEWMHVGRERMVQTAGRSQVVIFKVKHRRRLFRIRIGRYERERELLAEMHRIADQLPKIKRPMFGGW